jgi:hypothetical protein
MGSTEQTERLAAMVKGFRNRLLACGFVHANSAGELVNPSGEIWVRTAYAGGEFVVDTWVRPGGRSAFHEEHERTRIHPGTTPFELEALSDQLCSRVEGLVA